MSTAVVLPFTSRSRDTQPDTEALRAAIDACGASVARMQVAMLAKANLTGPAADLAACQFRLRVALGRAIQ
jgi:hypothetical protein